MKRLSNNLLLIAVLSVLLGCTAGHPLQFQDVNGQPHTPLAAQQPVVLLFITSDCPISNGYAPEVNRIVAAYTPKGVAFYLVHVDPDLKIADAKKHAEEFGYHCPVLIDAKHQLVEFTHATVTPEAAVLGKDGKLFYHGRIDDLYVGLGKRRPEATQHDLRDALDALLAGRSITNATTTAIGCYISK